MVEERRTVHEAPADGVERTTIVERRSSSNAWVWLIIALIVVAAAVYFLTQMSGAEVAKDTAIAEAANDVGEAAQDVGNAAQDAADNFQQ